MFELVKHCCLLCDFFLFTSHPVYEYDLHYIFNSESVLIHLNSISSFVSFCMHPFALSFSLSFSFDICNLNWRKLNTKLQHCGPIAFTFPSGCSFWPPSIANAKLIKCAETLSMNNNAYCAQSILFFHFAIPEFYNKTDKFLTKIC